MADRPPAFEPGRYGSVRPPRGGTGSSGTWVGPLPPSRDTEVVGRDAQSSIEDEPTFVASVDEERVAATRPNGTSSRPPQAPAPRAIVNVESVTIEPKDARAVLALDPDCERAASFRVLAQRVGRGREGKGAVLVASAEAGEGKSTCALNLALALAEPDRARVALLEANFRAPSLAKILGVAPRVCFGQQLALRRQQPWADWYLQQALIPSFHFACIHPETAPRGLVDAAPLGLAVRALLADGFAHVIVDGPSVLHQADANLAQEMVHGVVLAARARVSKGSLLRRAVDQLGVDRVIGAVLVDC